MYLQMHVLKFSKAVKSICEMLVDQSRVRPIMTFTRFLLLNHDVRY